MKRLTSFVIALALSTLPTSIFAHRALSQKQNREVSERLDFYLGSYERNHDFSGYVIVSKRGQVLYSRGFGKASFELGVPNTPDTRFRIASLTKTFTAAAIAMLQERGKLKFDDPLTKFIPDYPKGERIKLIHLLSHSGGVAEPDWKALSGREVTIEEVIETFKHKPLAYEPGTNHGYSNAGYILLAYVIQKVSGRSYRDFVAENIFAPLKMTTTGNYSARELVNNRANGYLPGPAPAFVENAPFDDMSSEIGAGSLYSSATDLLKWSEAVQAEKLFKMSALQYPFGWGKRKYLGHDAVEQTGITGGGGFTSCLQYFPKDRITIVFLSNLQSGLMNKVEKDLPSIVLGQAVEPVAPRREMRLDAASLSALAGTYVNPNFSMVISNRNGHLYYQWIGSTYARFLTPLSENELSARDEFANWKFSRDEHGNVTGFVWRSDSEKGLEFKKSSESQEE